MSEFVTPSKQILDPRVDLNKQARGIERLGGAKIPLGAPGQTQLTAGLRASTDIIIVQIRCTGLSAVDTLGLRFNGDSSASYWNHNDVSTAGNATFSNENEISQTSVRLAITVTGLTNNDDGGTQARFCFGWFNNTAGVEKIGQWFQCRATNSIATPGNLYFGTGSWVKTGQRITSVTLVTGGGVATMNAGTGITIFGKDYP